jgi:chromosome segregation ATPase
MGRKGITQADVNTAVEKLEAAGKKASIRTVREEIGSGSLSTIKTLLDNVAPAAQRRTEKTLPGRLLAAIAAELEKAKTEGAAEKDEETKAAKDDANALAKELARAEDEREELKAQNEKLSKMIAKQEGIIEEQMREIERLREDMKSIAAKKPTQKPRTRKTVVAK